MLHAHRFADGDEISARTSLRSPALILENDDIQVLGTTDLDAFDHLEVLESTAETRINGLALNAGVIHRVPDEVIAELERTFGLD